jgi:hypothetical protein
VEQESRISAEDRRLKIKAMIDALSSNEVWGVPPGELANRVHIPLSTLYRYLKHDAVRKTWESYQRESAGRVPANLEDLGDDYTFSVSDRD